MNDCQINESQKLFVMGSFQFRFVATVTVLLLDLVHALCFFLSRKQIGCHFSSLISSTG